MNAFLLYVVQSALCLSLFYGLYLLLLRREAFFRFNRNVLLTVMVLSMTIPLIRVPVAEPAMIQLPMLQLEEIVSNIEFKVQSSKYHVSSWAESENKNSEEFLGSMPETSNFKLQTSNLIPLAYLAGFFISLALALVSLISVARIIITARPVLFQRQRILVSPLQISSFTFAGWVVISEMDYERFAAEIVTHESIHRRSGHFWDLCLVNVIAVIHWFNPLVWLLRREVKTLHEYEADRCTLLHHGINATRYQLLLIEKAAGASRYSVASSFAQSKIKNRIIMMLKQNPNLWARWKALFFLPLAALLTLAFARPEINRELEQISALKSTEIYQENTGWTEEKFLEELRKCLPEGVSRDLSYEDTWNEIAKKYQFLHNGKYSEKDGMLIKMNKLGQMLINNRYATIEDVPVLVDKNLIANKESNFFKNILTETINGEKVNKIIKWTQIQRDVNAPPDEYQKLLNAVGDAYISKRNEMARQYFQTGYDALDAEKKALIDNVVPMLVWMEIPRGITYGAERIIQSGSWKDVEMYLKYSEKNDDNQLPTEEELKKAAAERKEAEAEFEKIINQQITYNNQQVTVKDLIELLKKDTDGKVLMSYRTISNRNTQERKNDVTIFAPAIDPKEPAYFYVDEGKWVYSLNMSIGLVKSIDVYAPADAVKKYGSKAKNGAISIKRTEQPVVIMKYGTAKQDNPDKK